MVHRIHNRNPGYSDFSNINNSSQFKLSTTMQGTPTMEGANALKIDNEVVTSSSSENESELESLNNLYNEEVVNNQKIEGRNDENLLDEGKKDSNGLENFDIGEETLELFDDNNSNNIETNETEKFSEEFKQEDQDDDELEIPAFLRRQKN